MYDSDFNATGKVSTHKWTKCAMIVETNANQNVYTILSPFKVEFKKISYLFHLNSIMTLVNCKTKHQLITNVAISPLMVHKN